MDDLISRRAAIEAAKAAMSCAEYITRDDYRTVIEWIEDVPSVQPELIRCKDCVHWDRDGVADEDGDKLCFYFSEGNCSYDFVMQPDDYCCFGERRDG